MANTGSYFASPVPWYLQQYNALHKLQDYKGSKIVILRVVHQKYCKIAVLTQFRRLIYYLYIYACLCNRVCTLLGANLDLKGFRLATEINSPTLQLSREYFLPCLKIP